MVFILSCSQFRGKSVLGLAHIESISKVWPGATYDLNCGPNTWMFDSIPYWDQITVRLHKKSHYFVITINI